MIVQVRLPFGTKAFHGIRYVISILPYTALCWAVWQAGFWLRVATCTRLRCAGFALIVLIISFTTAALHLLAKATCLVVLAIRTAVLIHLWLAPALGPLIVAMPVQVSKDMVDTSNNTGEIQARHSCSEKAATYSYTSTHIPQTRHVEAYCPRHEENPTEAAVLRNMLTRHSHQ